MKTALLRIALRQKAVFIPREWTQRSGDVMIAKTTSVLLANCNRLGYTFSEDLLRAINVISPKDKLEILEMLREVTGVRRNWTPLVKHWDIPTGEDVLDHMVAWIDNIIYPDRGTMLPCGHSIPENTFPIERYNGCPLCGKPFEFGELEYQPVSNQLKVLELWTEDDLQRYMVSLLESPVALDATQENSLGVLMGEFELPSDIDVTMKETLMVVIDALIAQGRGDAAVALFKTPNDVLRYLWYKHTGHLQIIKPRVLVKRKALNAEHIQFLQDRSAEARKKAIAGLKLKYNRKECKRAARWLNDLPMSVAKQCELMHPKRGMWVRFIRALRLAEYSQKSGFDRLAQVLDAFYNKRYEVWQGKLEAHKLKAQPEEAFALLKQRPGVFARSLFSSMLWFGPEITIGHFKEVVDELPPRLVFTLNMYADLYFDKKASRSVQALGGTRKQIPANKLLSLYEEEDLRKMQALVQELSLEVIKGNLRKVENENKTIYIDESLFDVPIAIGDRTAHLQDQPGALMGSRFSLQSEEVRLFMQWGEGLPAQHMDMDLSCKVIYDRREEFCSYARLAIGGCKHSGDIQRIPHKVGTAEYIELDLGVLKRLRAKYVIFTCNAYSIGSLAPNMVVGWMNSREKLRITSKGVAYHPGAVIHQVRITNSLTKGMVFGVLDIERNEIVWLEMPFKGQIVQQMDMAGVTAFLKKLESKLKVGQLLELKAEVQGLEKVAEPELADEAYTEEWALNTAEVSKLFLS